jgi:hypothetical protein
MRVGAHAARSLRRERGDVGAQRAVGVEQFARAGSCASISEQRDVFGLAAKPVSGTWCARQKPSTFTPSTVFGPVQPLGCAARSSASAAAG